VGPLSSVAMLLAINEGTCRRWGQRLPLSFGKQRMEQPVDRPHSNNLRVHREMDGPGTFLVTKCVEPRQRVIDERVALEICSSLCFYAEKEQILLAAFVVMLDHWHAVLATSDGMTIAKRLKILDQWISRQKHELLQANWEVISKRERRRTETASHFRFGWQQGFHETKVQSSKQFLFACAYVEENPVRAGLAKAVSDWKWSSANPEYQRFLARPWPWAFEKS
jgi:REP-associated tyrosine transposase